MRNTVILLAISTALMALTPIARAADGVAPEIQREVGTAQAVGQLHTLRTIPEACVRLQGQFTGDAKAPYSFEAVPRDRCAQRAAYVTASTLKTPPTVTSGWILNDRISVPRTDAPKCMAVLDVWRLAGQLSPPKLDPQGRSRLYLDKPKQSSAVPLYTAVLQRPKGCG